MVENSYLVKQSLSHHEVVELIIFGFTSSLRQWWEKNLTEEDRDLIHYAVQHEEAGYPIFDETIGQGVSDGINTIFRSSILPKGLFVVLVRLFEGGPILLVFPM